MVVFPGPLQVVTGRRRDVFNLEQRAVVGSLRRGIMRCHATVAHQCGRPAGGEPSFGMELERVPVPAFGIHTATIAPGDADGRIPGAVSRGQ